MSNNSEAKKTETKRVIVFKDFSEDAKALSARLLFPLKPGDKVYRPVVYYNDFTERLGNVVKPFVLTPRFNVNASKQALIKAQKWQSADGRYVALESVKNGVVLFCSEPIPETWTYFEVTSIGTKGKCAFVKPVCGDEMELISLFKRRSSDR